MFSIQLGILFFLICFYLLHFHLPIPTFSSLEDKIEKKELPPIVPKITFYTKEDTQEFIEDDKDGFMKDLDQPNLLARKVSSVKEYQTIARKAAADFTEKEKKRLTEAILSAVKVLQGISHRIDTKYGLDQKRLETVLQTWNLAKTKDNVVEMGMPHTRQNVIFLSTLYLAKTDSNQKKLTETMIHEIYHIYQRTYAKDYQEFLIKAGWVVVPYNKTDKRINPDLDNLVWKKGEKIYIARFAKAKPKDLKEITTIEAKDEHPNEYYAYRLVEDLNL